MVKLKLKFYTYIDAIRVKNENCEFLQNLFTDILVALSVETLEVREVKKTSQTSLTVVTIETTIGF